MMTDKDCSKIDLYSAKQYKFTMKIKILQRRTNFNDNDIIIAYQNNVTGQTCDIPGNAKCQQHGY